MDVIVRFAKAGLIHGDYNEFNILIRRYAGPRVKSMFSSGDTETMARQGDWGASRNRLPPDGQHTTR